MCTEIVEPLCDPVQVAKVIQSYPECDQIYRIMLSEFDNLRPLYSAEPTLEIAGIALTEQQIGHMVQMQAIELHRLASRFSRITLLWKAESGRIYANALAAELQSLSDVIVQIPIWTRWLKNNCADVIDGTVSEVTSSDFVVVVDFMCGSGGTLVAIKSWLAEKRIAPHVYVVLVNATNYYRTDDVPNILTPCFVWTSIDWLIGFNSDCPRGKTQLGRELPFLAFLKPAGSGIRKALTDVVHGWSE